MLDFYPSFSVILSITLQNIGGADELSSTPYGT